MIFILFLAFLLTVDNGQKDVEKNDMSWNLTHIRQPNSSIHTTIGKASSFYYRFGVSMQR